MDRHDQDYNTIHTPPTSADTPDTTAADVTAADMTAFDLPTDTSATPPVDSASVRRTFSRVGLAVGILTITLFFAQYALDFLLYYLVPGYVDTWWRTWVLSLVPLYAIALPVFLLCLIGCRPAPHRTDARVEGATVEKPPLGFRWWLVLLVIGFGCMYAGSYIGQTMMSILSAIVGYDYANGLNAMVESAPVWVTFIATCICAPFGEELIFRKLLIDRTRRYGDAASILVSGVLFGLFHMNFFQFFYAAALGMVLAYIYTRTGRYLPCVAMHAVINFMGSIVIPRIASILPEDGKIESLLQVVVSLGLTGWSFGLMTAALVFACVFAHRRRLSPAPLENREMARAVLLNPGMITCLVILAIMMMLSLIPA